MLLLLAALALTGGELASNVALAGHIEAIEHQPIVIESTIEIPVGYAIIDQEWELEKPAKGTVDTSGNLFNVWGPPREEPYELLHKVQIAKTHKLEDGSLAAVLPFRKVRKAYQITIKAARPRPPPVTPEKPAQPTLNKPADAAAIVFESSQGAVPLHADAAARELRSGGKTVYVVDKDAETGTGGTPEHLRPFLDAAAKVQLPALVIAAGGRYAATALPATKAAILEAVK